MKKFFTLAIFGLLGTGAFAQTTQGSVVVSGALGYSKTTQKGNDFGNSSSGSTFNISPSIGFLVQDRLELGAAIGYNYAQESNDILTAWGMEEQELTTNVFSFAPYLKKYFMLSEKVAFTGSAFAGYSTGTMKIDFEGFGGGAELKVSGFQAGFVPGITFFATEKIGISANFGSLGYSQISVAPEEGGDKMKTTTFGLDLNASTLAVGFNYYINR